MHLLHVHKSYYQKSYITFSPVDVLGQVTFCIQYIFINNIAFFIIKIAYVYLHYSRPYNIGAADVNNIISTERPNGVCM